MHARGRSRRLILRLNSPRTSRLVRPAAMRATFTVPVPSLAGRSQRKQKKPQVIGLRPVFLKRGRRDSNPQPPDRQSGTLTN